MEEISFEWFIERIKNDSIIKKQLLILTVTILLILKKFIIQKLKFTIAFLKETT